MLAHALDFLLLAQADGTPPADAAGAWYQEWYGIVLIIAAILLIPWYAGQFMARSLRMRDYGWKIAVILMTVIAGSVVIALGEFKRGFDLAGGTSLIYEVDQEKKTDISDRDEKLMEKLITAISQRIDPAGVMQVTIRKYGEEQVEIIIPKVNPEEIEQIKRKISTAGNLEFRILADADFDESLAARAEESDRRQIKNPDEEARRNNPQHTFWIREAEATAGNVVEKDGRIRTRWVPVKPEDVAEIKRRQEEDKLVVRTTDSGQLEQLVIVGQVVGQWVKIGELDRDDEGSPEYRVNVDEWSVYRPRNDGGRDVLVVIDDLNVNGGYLSSSRPGFRDAQVCVDFSFNNQGAKKFGALTSANLPESGRKRRLGIVLDDELLSAPQLNTVIRESGQITGNFTDEEVAWLVGVLNAGRLPAALNKEPISEQSISPTLGQQTIESGTRAIAISLIAVLAFMPVYYRFAGFVAGFALLLNLILVLGVMIAIGAAFTLPGLAGLVLTVGMAVDANVLIFERIREETDRGAALRMAIRNGFGRATRTIVDANLTTLITGVVLYVVGTDQIKGFAVTLILGIAMSMFTAIFCSRVIFDVAEKKRWLTKLTMTRIVGKTNIDFLGRRHIAGVCSVLLISLGIFGVFHRGEDLLDIDFRGGVRIEAAFEVEENDADLYKRLLAYSDKLPEEDRLNDLRVVGIGEGGRQFIIETTQDKMPVVQKAIMDEFGDELRTNKLKFDPNAISVITAPAPATEADNTSTPGPAGENPAKADRTENAPSSESPPGKEEPADKSGAGGNNKTDDNGKAPATDDGPANDEGARRELPPLSLLALAQNDEPKTTATDAESGIGAEVESAGSDPTAGDDKAADSADAQPAEGADEANTAEESPTKDAPPSDSSGEAESKEATGDTTAATTDATDAGSTDEAAPKAVEPKTDGDATTPKAGTDTAPPKATETNGAEAAAATSTKASRFAGGSEVELTFLEPLNQVTLTELLQQLIEEQELPSPDIDVTSPGIYGESVARATNWKLQTTLDADDTNSLLEGLKKRLASEPLFPSATNIGGQVAGDTQSQALAALIASLLFIVTYIWIRFQRVAYGLAAVVALVHDVLVTLGVIALSDYVTSVPGLSAVLQMEPFKISLPILAAFLTIIGYSLNDTIVVFDRIREVKGKSPDLTSDMVNLSINQTLSRTLLTSITTLIVVLILYFIGGPGIHGFAFALVIGVVVGTYSSIFIASPSLLWMQRVSAAGESSVRSQSEAAVAG